MNVTQTSKASYSDLQWDIGTRQQQVLDALFTLGKANNKMIAHYLRLGINQVCGRMKELRDLKLVGFSHEDICPFTKKNTMYWKVTKYGELLAEKMDTPQKENLLLRPFQISEGDSYTRFTAQIKSSTLEKFYSVEIQMIWDWENKEYHFKKFCECEGFLYRKDCKHCIRLQEELKRWNVI